MAKYNYKQFEIIYIIEHDKKNKDFYTADGYAICSLDKQNTILSRKFHTEDTSKTGVQTEIKRLIENYIDFEWQKFYEVHGKSKKAVKAVS